MTTATLDDLVNKVTILDNNTTALITAVQTVKVGLQANIDGAATSAAASATSASASAVSAQASNLRANEAQSSVNLAAASAAVTLSDKGATAADRVQTGLDKVATAADRVQTGLDKGATAADRVQTGLDKVATAADRVQTVSDKAGTAADRVTTTADRAQTLIDKTAASNSASAAAGSAAAVTAIYGTTNAFNAKLAEAAAQSQLAQTAASSASSILSQDLSAVSAALHRSPSAVTAMCIYDLSLDSDGGAWRERMGHTSWMNEPLCGAWLTGGFASELAARGDNLLTYAEQIDDASWAKFGISIAPNAITAPDGTSSMDTIAEDGTVGVHYTSKAFAALILGAKYTLSCYAKQGIGARYFGMNVAGGTPGAVFDLVNGTVVGTQTGAATGVTSEITPVGNGVYLCKLSFNSSFNGTSSARLGLANISTASNPSYQGDGASSVSVWGAKFTQGAFTPYVPYSAQTNSFFQYSVDGKFYKLGAGYGALTEVFRGNKAKFPRLAAIVAETSSLTIYDLTEPGRPMWMRFGFPGMVGNLSSVQMLNGVLCTANDSASSFGILLWDFAKDIGRIWYNSGNKPSTGGVIGRLSWVAAFPGAYVGAALINPAVNSVALTVLPDAPFDVATGLQVPTIAVATAGGVSVIKQDGTVTNLAPATGGNIYFDKKGNAVNIGENTRNYRKFLAPGYTTALTYTGGPLNLNGPAAVLAGGPVHKVGKDISALLRNNSNIFGFLRENDQTPSKSLYAEVAASYGTGYMVGDIKRAYLCNTEVESVTATELMVNGGFDTDLAGWSNPTDGRSTSAWVSGKARVSNVSAGYGYIWRTVPTVIGKTYTVTASAATVGGARARGIRVGVNETATQVASAYAVTDGLVVTFTALAATTYIALTVYVPSFGADNEVDFDNISVKEVIADRSYKAAGANIYGTLVKSQVASAAQLVAWSGFTEVNYIQEAYLSDMDYGVGDWSIGAWVSYTTAEVAAIAERSAATGPSIRLGTDSAGKLIATAYDGTTTRTVTTPAAYNTGAWTKVRATYTAATGKLGITVNGVEVASTSGTPLLTMSNANAVLTIGNSRALDSRFTGSITLLKTGATVPTVEQSLWMYGQEKQMFRDGAQITLPAATAVTDLAYDESQDKWVALQAGYESSFTGLIRTSAAVPSAGSFSRVDAKSGVKLLARTTTDAGVDVTVPAMNLRAELVRRAEAAARLAKPEMDKDEDFIAGQTDYVAPAGYIVTGVAINGNKKREGATKDYVKLFDGFRETTRLAVAPGAAAWGQFTIRKE